MQTMSMDRRGVHAIASSAWAWCVGLQTSASRLR